MAITILGMIIMFMSTDLLSSAGGTQLAHARMVASQLANQTLQQADNLNYETVSEGVQCNSACDALVYPDPNNHLFQATDGCWYYYAAAPAGAPGTKPAPDGLLVPTTTAGSSGTNDVPVIPNVTTASSPYPPETVGGITYTIATYPFINESTYPAVTCTTEGNDSAPQVPITVVTTVSWAKNTQQLTSESSIFAPPLPLTSAGGCPTPAVLQGAHDESLMAYLADQQPLASKPADTTKGIWYSTSITPGTSKLYAWFFDEQPTPYQPLFCVQDTAGNTEAITPSYYSCIFGTSSADPCGSTRYYSDSGCSGSAGAGSPYPCGFIPAHKAFAASGPNADDPPAGGTTCTSGTCPLEDEFSFQVPAQAPSGLGIQSITVADHDHEGDLDWFTWCMSSTCGA